MESINLMERAILEARKAHTPFGAVLYNGKKFISAANTGRTEGKVHHAELNVFLKMPAGFKSDNSPLELFTTCEPCAMCMGAAIWSGVDKIYYGVDIETAANFLNQIHIAAKQINEQSFRRIEIFPDKMRNECLSLFEEFA